MPMALSMSRIRRPVETLLLPCRHSILCIGCVQELRSRRSMCPICRGRIDFVQRGHYNTTFVGYADRFVNAATAEVATARSRAYHGIYALYQQWSWLIALGVVSLMCSAVSFFTCYGPWKALAVIAFFIGYIPWFVVTVVALEDEEADESRSRPPLLSRDDCARPCLLLAKVALGPLIAIVALIFFYIPYAIHAFALRPLAKHVLPSLLLCALRLLEESAYYLYVAFTGLGLGLMRCIQHVCAQVCHCIGLLVDRVTALVGLLHRNVFAPAAHAACRCVHCISRGIYACLAPPVGAACECMQAVGRSVSAGACALLDGLIVVVVSVHTHTLEPAGRAFCCLIQHIGRGIHACTSSLAHLAATVATAVHVHMLIPLWKLFCQGVTVICKGICACLCCLSRGIVTVAGAVYVYALVPVMRATGRCIQSMRWLLSECMSVVATVLGAVYMYILAPVRRCCCNCIESISRGVRMCASLLAQCVTMAARAVYVNALVPIGRAVSLCITSLILALTHAVASMRSAIAACASSIGSAIATTGKMLKANLVWPVWRFVGSVRSAVISIARDVKDAFFPRRSQQ
eukprot:gnl/TRDRNA2_/TRDRNA2_94656_c0_seq2.p1 gnl/TRDRNA2_/TRDRNA2_94656_c0~~gnl/TRDRNA2_/TRDRNA2_94656_c0_seq2.p1  ORF type:complete len:575 (-),score=15.09 gnl/TRDRNA2_/TRDRNA2_94656_c0_seq2:51-1775(-)